VDYETRAGNESEAKLLTAQARHIEAEIALLKANSEDGHIALTMEHNEEINKRSEALAIRSHELAMKKAEGYQLYSMWRTLILTIGTVAIAHMVLT